jgi:TolB-like protein/Flp pilus assembly protein TadD
VPAELVRAELAKVLASRDFARSPRLARFLQFIVERSLEGRGQQLKEYVLALEVFDRESTFDPRLDPIVRVEAVRLRAKLKKYYETDGLDDAVHLELPKRSYAPVFVRRESSPAPATPEPQAPSTRPWSRPAWAAAILVVMSAAAAVALRAPATGPSGPAKTVPPASSVSIAVLPFADLSPQNDQEYLSDGLAEQLIHNLTRVDGLRVIPWTSVFRLKGQGQDIRKIGEDLKVQYVLEGSVRRAGRKLLVSVRGSDVEAGYTLWAENYERPAENVVAIQEELAQAVIGSLRTRLRNPGAAVIASRTDSNEAFNSYLRGRYHLNRRSEESLQKAIGYFEQALRHDPNYAVAYSGLADAYALRINHGTAKPRELMPAAKAAAEKALKLQPSLAEAHASMGYVALTYDWDLPASQRYLARALKLNPQYAEAHHWFGFSLVAAGHFDEALPYIARAEELDPLSPVIPRFAGDIYYRKGDYEQAIRKCREALELDPNYVAAYHLLGRIYEQRREFARADEAFRKARQLQGPKPPLLAMEAHTYAVSGRRGEALRILGQLQETSRQVHVSPFYTALIYAGLGDKDRAFAWLEKVYEERSFWMIVFPTDPRFQPLRSDPRFDRLLQRVNLLRN